ATMPRWAFPTTSWWTRPAGPVRTFPPAIFGYELTEDGYQPLPPDAQGRWWIASVGLWLGTEGAEVVWFDEDGRRIWDYEEEQAARLAEQQARLAEQQFRLLAERRAQEEQAARLVSEKRATTAEERATVEQQARLAAEERARELERLLQQLQGRMTDEANRE
ncbi:MAG: hypothetical protein HC884_14760, partial [Chloroflexaceae bacterium]|nr:hypothetical protein [Chloroflexaceae bacterium]